MTTWPPSSRHCASKGAESPELNCYLIRLGKKEKKTLLASLALSTCLLWNLLSKHIQCLCVQLLHTP